MNGLYSVKIIDVLHMGNFPNELHCEDPCVDMNSTSTTNNAVQEHAMLRTQESKDSLGQYDNCNK